MRRKRMRRTGSRIGALALATLMLAAAGAALAAAPVGTGTTTAPLPNDGLSHAFSAPCPAGMEPSGGGIRLGDDVSDFVQGTYPDGEAGWTSVGYRRATAVGPSSVSVYARCLKAGKVSTRSKEVSLTDVMSLDTVTAKCPKGTMVGGGGVQLGDNLADYVSGSYPLSKREWIALGHGSDSIVSIARCVKGTKLEIKSKTITMPNDNDTHTVTAKCPKGMESTGGGGRLSDPLSEFFQGSYPTGKSKWTAAGFDGGQLTAYVICR